MNAWTTHDSYSAVLRPDEDHELRAPKEGFTWKSDGRGKDFPNVDRKTDGPFDLRSLQDQRCTRAIGMNDVLNIGAAWRQFEHKERVTRVLKLLGPFSEEVMNDDGPLLRTCPSAETGAW